MDAPDTQKLQESFAEILKEEPICDITPQNAPGLFTGYVRGQVANFARRGNLDPMTIDRDTPIVVTSYEIQTAILATLITGIRVGRMYAEQEKP